MWSCNAPETEISELERLTKPKARPDRGGTSRLVGKTCNHDDDDDYCIKNNGGEDGYDQNYQTHLTLSPHTSNSRVWKGVVWGRNRVILSLIRGCFNSLMMIGRNQIACTFFIPSCAFQNHQYRYSVYFCRKIAKEAKVNFGAYISEMTHSRWRNLSIAPFGIYITFMATDLHFFETCL